MNNKGFAVTGIIYSVLLIFLIMMTTMLFNLQNRKIILDELKLDAVDAVESENNYEYLLNEINALKAQIGDTDLSYTDISDKITPMNLSTNVFSLEKWGQVVYLSFDVNLNTDYSGDMIQIGYINDEKYYPKKSKFFTLFRGSSSSLGTSCRGQITPAGEIKIICPSDSSGACRGTVSYLIN